MGGKAAAEKAEGEKAKAAAEAKKQTKVATTAKAPAKELAKSSTEVNSLFSRPRIVAHAGKLGFTSTGQPLWPGAIDAYKADQTRQAARLAVQEQQLTRAQQLAV